MSPVSGSCQRMRIDVFVSSALGQIFTDKRFENVIFAIISGNRFVKINNFCVTLCMTIEFGFVSLSLSELLG